MCFEDDLVLDQPSSAVDHQGDEPETHSLHDGPGFQEGLPVLNGSTVAPMADVEASSWLLLREGLVAQEVSSSSAMMRPWAACFRLRFLDGLVSATR